MAVVTVKSGPITNRDASPRVRNGGFTEGGMMREVVGTVAIATGDTSTSKYILCQIPSSARVSQIIIYSDDCGSVTTADFGLYETTENGGAVVLASAFASAVSLKDGALNAQDITHEAAVTLTSGLNGGEKRVWEVAALAADTNKMYDLVATLTATCDVGGQLLVKVRYVL